MTSTQKPFDGFDPTSREFLADRHATYRRLRTETPVLRCTQGYWVLSRYREVKATLGDERFGIDIGPVAESASHMTSMGMWKRLRSMFSTHAQTERPSENAVHFVTSRSLYGAEPTVHAALRAAAADALRTLLHGSMRAEIEQSAASLLERAAARGAFDAVADFADLLPTDIIATTLGVPVNERERFRYWLAEAPGVFDFTPSPDAASARERATKTSELFDYLGRLIAQRRRRPTDDLVSALVRAGRGYSAEIILATCGFMAMAGQESTRAAIGCAVYHLLRNRKQFEQLARIPRSRRPAVEELLRFITPGAYVPRRATEDVEIGGAVIGAGEPVWLLLASANRDPEQFKEPDVLDVSRWPNPHVAFGGGQHACVGAALARFELEVALDGLVRTVPELRLAAEPDQMRHWPLHGPLALAVEC